VFLPFLLLYCPFSPLPLIAGEIMTYTIASYIVLMRCEDSYLIVRVVYKNPAVQQAFSGLSLCLIKNEK